MRLLLAALALFTSVAVAQTSPYSGGTGIRNLNSSTLTLAGPIATVGAFSLALSMTAPTTLTLPVSGTLATTAQITGGTLPGSFTTLTASGLIFTAKTGGIMQALSGSTAASFQDIANSGGTLRFGVESSVGGTIVTGATAFSTFFGSLTATPLQFHTGDVVRMTISPTGAVSFGANSVGGGAASFATFTDDASNLIISSTNPTVASGFGTAPTCSPCNNTAAFRVTVGTAPGNTGTVTLPAAPTGWACYGSNRSNNAFQEYVTSTATSVTVVNWSRVTAGDTNFGAGDVVVFQCAAF